MAKSKKLKHFFKKISKSAFFMNLASSLLFWYAKLIWRSTHWKIVGLEKLMKTWHKEQSIILVSWHGRAIMIPQLLPLLEGKQMNALVSLHNDGQLIAKYLKKLDVVVVGGSSNNNAKAAALNIMHLLQNNESITIIPDGPRGPRMRMVMSPIYFAHKTGKPIYAMAYSTNKAKIIEKAWDKTLVPLPFGQGIYNLSDAFYVPTDASDAELEQYRQKLEDLLNDITHQADAAMGIPEILPDDNIKKKRHQN